jgi:hypothetical protein
VIECAVSLRSQGPRQVADLITVKGDVFGDAQVRSKRKSMDYVRI